MGEEYVKRIEIREIASCFFKPGRIRVEAQTMPEGGKPLADLLYVILLKYPPSMAKLDEGDQALTLRMYDRIIGVFSSGTIGMQNTKDEKEAKEILEGIRNILNEAYRDFISKGRPTPNAIRRRLNLDRLSTFQIMKCLPNRTHCRRCGEPSCSSFAFKLRSGEADVADCEVLKGKEFEVQRRTLVALLEGIEGTQ